MTRITRSIVVLCLIALAGCGHLAVNYPAARVKTPKPLPETFESRGTGRRLVWREANQLHGFYFNTKMVQETIKMLEGLAEQGVGRAVMDLPLMRQAGKEGLARVTLQVFVAHDFTRGIRRGDLKIRFTDGTEVRDEGAILVPIIGTGKPAKSTRNGTVTLDSSGDEDMKGRSMIIFVPAAVNAKHVESVAFFGE